MARPYHEIDVFAEEALAGNPLALVHQADGLSDERMQQLAAWTDLSETAFLLPPTDPAADYRVRIFTPTRELPFAGHPTLGSCRGWLEAGGRPAVADTIVQECGLGLVTLRQQGDVLAFAAPPLLRDEPVAEDEVARLARTVGLDPAVVVDARLADNGPGWVVLLLRSVDDVLAARATMSDRPLHLGLVGFHRPGPDHRSATAPTVELRALHSAGGPVLEDPVTGSLNAAAAQWLVASGRITGRYLAGQGRCVGRDGRIVVEPDGDAIWIGGRTTVVVSGTVEL